MSSRTVQKRTDKSQEAKLLEAVGFIMELDLDAERLWKLRRKLEEIAFENTRGVGYVRPTQEK